MAMHTPGAGTEELLCATAQADMDPAVDAPNGGFAPYRSVAVTTLRDHRSKACARTPTSPCSDQVVVRASQQSAGG